MTKCSMLSLISLIQIISFPAVFIQGLEHCFDQVSLCTPGWLFCVHKPPTHEQTIVQEPKLANALKGASVEKKKPRLSSTQFFSDDEVKSKALFDVHGLKKSFFVMSAGTWYQARRYDSKIWSETVENSPVSTETVAGEAFWVK